MPNSRGKGRYGSPVGKKKRGAVTSACGNRRERSASTTTSSDTSWTDTSDTSIASTVSSKSSSSGSSVSSSSGTSSGSSSSTATSSSSSGSSRCEDSSCNEDSDDDEAGGVQRGRPRHRLIRFRHRREASVKCRHCGFKGYIASKECFFCGSATSHSSSGRTSKEPCGAVEELCNLLEVATLPEDSCSTPTETAGSPAPSPSGRYVWSPCSSQSSGSNGSSSSTLSESGDWHLYLSDDEMEKDTSPRKQLAPAIVSLDD